MRVLVRTAADITERERALCFSLWDRAFPQPAGQVRTPDFAEPTTIAVLIEAAAEPAAQQAVGNLLVRTEVGSLVAACRVRDRAIIVAGQPVRVAGLASVAVVEDRRGQGLGAHLVHLATDVARVEGYAWSVLFCSPAKQAYYARLGWQPLDGDVRVGPDAAATPLDRGEDAVMALPLTRQAAHLLPTWRTSQIVLPSYW